MGGLGLLAGHRLPDGDWLGGAVAEHRGEHRLQLAVLGSQPAVLLDRLQLASQLGVVLPYRLSIGHRSTADRDGAVLQYRRS